jgi:hypothetical protein
VRRIRTDDWTNKFFLKSWTTQKTGNLARENEDAFRAGLIPGAEDTLLVALADGATEAVYSGPWARALVDAALPNWPWLDDTALGESLDLVRKRFVPFAGAVDLPWYVVNKYRLQGSQATLLVAGLRKTAGGGLVLRAIAAGDTCVAILRQTGEVTFFPIEGAEDFHGSPDLVSTLGGQECRFQRLETTVEPGDVFLACTDAMAKWILDCLESCQSELAFRFLKSLCRQQAPELRAISYDPGESQPVTAAGSKLDQLLRLLPTFRLWWNFLEPFPEAEEEYDLAGESLILPALKDDEAASLFERSVSRYRLPGKHPQMRNDDATLVLGLLLDEAGDDPEREVDQALERMIPAYAERFAPTRRLAVAGRRP